MATLVLENVRTSEQMHKFRSQYGFATVESSHLKKASRGTRM
jgi:hypothetical protein